MTINAVLWVSVSSDPQAVPEKESLPEQERQLRAAATAHGWSILDIIMIPGHSRVYYNYLEFATAAAAEGIEDPMRMFEHWERRDFQILACFDGSRFGREQSIFAEFAARTYDAGARIFSLADGLIEPNNRRFWVSMAGYKAAAEVDLLKERRRFGMAARAKRGLKTSPRDAFGYTEVRDPRTGKAIETIVDESLRPVWNKIAELAIEEHISWGKLEKELFARYGYGENGKPYPRYSFYQRLNTPTVWGHRGTGYLFTPPKGSNQRHKKHLGLWAFDETVPLPPGVSIIRNTHPPIFEGELAERLKDELRRRATMRGSHKPGTKNAFAGLLVCGECGFYISRDTIDGHRVYHKCTHRARLGRSVCNQGKHLRDDKLQAFFREEITSMLKAQSPDYFQIEQVNYEGDIERLKHEQASVEQQMHKFMALMRSTDVNNPAWKMYSSEMEQLGVRQQALEQDLKRLEGLQSNSDNPRRRRAYLKIEELGERFWELPPAEINQWLHMLYGDYRYVVLEAKIVKLAFLPPKRRLPRSE